MGRTTIGASRIVAPPDDGKRVCFRCGQRFGVKTSAHLVAGAPCLDCREYFAREEGETTVWDSRKPNAGVRTWMTAEERAERARRYEANRAKRERAQARKRESVGAVVDLVRALSA